MIEAEVVKVLAPELEPSAPPHPPLALPVLEKHSVAELEKVTVLLPEYVG